MALIPFQESSQLSGSVLLTLPSLGTISLQTAQAGVTTPSNTATALFTWLPPSDGTYTLLSVVCAKKISDGSSAGFYTMTVVKVILGVITIVGDVAIHAAVADGGFAPTIAYAVVGSTLQLQGTGVAATPILWQANVAGSVS